MVSKCGAGTGQKYQEQVGFMLINHKAGPGPFGHRGLAGLPNNTTQTLILA